MLNNSIIIVAHLDDEALWFSSILDKVDKVLICFLKYGPLPELGVGRKKSIGEYPLKNIHCLGIDESETFNAADWNTPIITKYGIEISNNRVSKHKYENNYYTLLKRLKKEIAGYANVFTHNPWGEYGHEEHIQVYRVLKELKNEMNYNLYFPNYCSNLSYILMIEHTYDKKINYSTKMTNTKLAGFIKNILLENSCWTWFDDWIWFETESFILDEGFGGDIKFGHLLPVNLIKVPDIKNPEKSPNIIIRKLRRFNKIFNLTKKISYK